MEILEFIIAVLATYRMAHLLPQDDGPLFVFKRIRSFTTGKNVSANDPWGIWANIDEGIHCVYCMGLYAAIFCSLIMLWYKLHKTDDYKNGYKAGNLFLLIMAIAGGQSLLQTLGEKNEKT